jgi:hypothetical protein
VRTSAVFLAFCVSALFCSAQISASYGYQAANYYFANQDVLNVFPFDGPHMAIKPQSRETVRALFEGDGKSFFDTDYLLLDNSQKRHLWKVHTDPIRRERVRGAEGLAVDNFVVSSRQDLILVSGRVDNGGGCGVFAVHPVEGRTDRILETNCGDWSRLSTSPDGSQAVGTVGKDEHLVVIDMLNGSTRPLAAERSTGVWSPDGRWIAVLGDWRHVYLIDARDTTRHRDLGRTGPLTPAWSPDSKYLLAGKTHPFKCGFYLDVEPPESLEVIDVQTGRRTMIESSACQIYQGNIGWLSRDKFER